MKKKENETTNATIISAAGDHRYYRLTNDYMFKVVMQNSKGTLKALICSMLGIDRTELTSCDILNPIELGDAVTDKTCILDLKLLLNGTELIDLEMQVSNFKDWTKRSMLYWCRNFDDIKEGKSYAELKKTIHLGILDFTLFEDHPEFYAQYKILNVKDGYPYGDLLDIRVLDLTNIDLASPEESQIALWAKIFKANSWDELQELASQMTWAKEEAENMVVTMRKVTEEEKIRWQIQQREDYDHTMASQYESGFEDGITAGIEQGVKQGIKQEHEKTLAAEAKLREAELKIAELLKLQEHK